MNTALTTNHPEAIGSYFSMYRELMTAQHYVCKTTGKLIPLTLEKKVIWCWMIDRYNFFKNQNKSFFDNQADVALACGVSVSTVKRFLAELTDAVDKNGKPLGAGYIQTTCTRISGHKSNSYILLSDLMLVQPERTQNNAKNNATLKAALPPTETENASNDAVFPIEKHDFDTNLDGGIPAGESFAFEVIPFADEGVFIPELEDDGSVYDALTFVDIADTTKSVNSKPTVVALPDKRFNPNGTASDAMIAYCKAKSIKIKTENDTTVFIVDGKECKITADGFVPYTPAPKSKAVPQHAAPETSPWGFEPF